RADRLAALAVASVLAVAPAFAWKRTPAKCGRYLLREAIAGRNSRIPEGCAGSLALPPRFRASTFTGHDVFAGDRFITRFVPLPDPAAIAPPPPAPVVHLTVLERRPYARRFVA